MIKQSSKILEKRIGNLEAANSKLKMTLQSLTANLDLEFGQVGNILEQFNYFEEVLKHQLDEIIDQFDPLKPVKVSKELPSSKFNLLKKVYKQLQCLLFITNKK